MSTLWKVLLGGAAVVAAGCLLASLADSDGSDDDDDDSAESLEAILARLSMPPGKAHEQEVGDLLETANPGATVLRNPSYRRADGSLRKPDIVILHPNKMIEVQECKDVAELRTRHVLQTLEYHSDIADRSGIVVSERTVVSDRVAQLAELVDISITRKV